MNRSPVSNNLTQVRAREKAISNLRPDAKERIDNQYRQPLGEIALESSSDMLVNAAGKRAHRFAPAPPPAQLQCVNFSSAKTLSG